MLLYYFNNGLKRNVAKTEAMVFGNCSKLDRLNRHQHFETNWGKCRICKAINLPVEIVLDNEITIKPRLHGINKRISDKLFMLRTIHKYLNYDNSILVYKQTIMTIFNYSGFMLFSLDVIDKRDLWMRKNDELRFCYNVKLMNCVSIVDLQ